MACHCNGGYPAAGFGSDWWLVRHGSRLSGEASDCRDIAAAVDLFGRESLFCVRVPKIRRFEVSWAILPGLMAIITIWWLAFKVPGSRCVCAWVRACMSACVRACVRVCVSMYVRVFQTVSPCLSAYSSWLFCLCVCLPSARSWHGVTCNIS